MFANCTYISVGLVTDLGIECDDAAFLRHFKKICKFRASSIFSLHQVKMDYSHACSTVHHFTTCLQGHSYGKALPATATKVTPVLSIQNILESC